MTRMERHRLLGVEVDAATMADLHACIDEAVRRERRIVIANHNMHSVHLFHGHEKMRALYERADYAHIDSMPLVFLGRMLGLPLRREHRVTYVDWVEPLMQHAAARGMRMFYLGAQPGVAERGAEILREKIPGLEIATEHGYFDAGPDSEDNARVVAKINAYRPDILLLGMGMPRQEFWTLDNVDRLECHVILHGGAVMDYVTGTVPTPPRWAGRVGFEWLYRLIAEPRRLWRRYLVEPFSIARALIRPSKRVSSEPGAADE